MSDTDDAPERHHRDRWRLAALLFGLLALLFFLLLLLEPAVGFPIPGETVTRTTTVTHTVTPPPVTTTVTVPAGTVTKAITVTVTTTITVNRGPGKPTGPGTTGPSVPVRAPALGGGSTGQGPDPRLVVGGFASLGLALLFALVAEWQGHRSRGGRRGTRRA